MQAAQFDQHYVKILSKVFIGMDEEVIKKILKECSISHIETGELLIKQGDLGKSMFVVLSGRFRVVAKIGDVHHKLGEVSEGEPIGEFSLFTKEKRMASAYAMRPSVIIEITEMDYFRIISIYPVFASKLTATLIKRVKNNFLQNHLQAPAKNIALINLQPDNDISPWTDAVQISFNQKGVKIQTYTHESYSNVDQNEFFKSIEKDDGLKFLVCNEKDPIWSKNCILYADLVIIATDFYADSQIYDIEQKLDLYQQNIINKKKYLLLLHPENANHPKNTNRWFENRKIDLHIHFRKNHVGDAARFSRIITNQAVGLVLGGGGAKGFAHVGAVKAMINAGIPIDILGGTSAGALYGMAMVYCDFDLGKIDFHTEQGVSRKLTSNDFTVPVISLLSGKKMSNYLKDLFGNFCLEDFWISTYCISSNFSTASVNTHKSGLAYKKVLASISIPGVFPPVIIDNELHVDGCVMDNLPIQSMYSFPVRYVIAIALSGSSSSKIDINEIPSTSSVFWDSILNRKKYNIPGLTSIIINSLTLNSTQRQEQYKSEVTFYIELDLKGTSFLDDSKWKLVVQKGYDQMSEYIEKVKPADKFW